MAGDSISSEANESAERKERSVGQKLFSALFIGFFLFTVILFSLVGIVSLYLFVIIPLEQWANEFAISSILFEIPIIVFLTLSIIAVILVIGRISRGGIEPTLEISLPQNRKCIFTQGLLVYISGVALQISSFSLIVRLESSLETWSNQMPGNLGDFVVGMITSSIFFVVILLTGMLGYLIATKLPIFKNAEYTDVSSVL